MAVFEQDGVRLQYEDTSGLGTPVLLIHGTAADLWGEVPAALAPHRVIRYARRGFDGSTGPQPSRLHEHVGDAVGLLDTLRLRSCVVVGWSIGGVLALDLALSDPARIAGLVLVEPPWHVKRAISLRLLRGPVAAMIRGRRNPVAGAELFLRWALRDTTGADPRSTVPAGWWEQMTNNSAAIVHEAALGTGEYLSRRSLASLSCRTVILAGDRSEPSFARAAARVAAALPDANFTRVTKSGHVMQADRPDAIIDAVETVESLRPRANVESPGGD